MIRHFFKTWVLATYVLVMIFSLSVPEQAAASMALAASSRLSGERHAKIKAEFSLRLGRSDSESSMFTRIGQSEKTASERVLKLFDRMVSEDRITILADSEFDALLVGAKLCESVRCETMKGFYLPSSHQIFIRDTTDERSFARALYHELYHAYQFLYRLPVDAGSLLSAAKSGLLQKQDIATYLDFFYEAQANWKTMRVYPDSNWKKEFRNSTTAHIKTIALFFAGGGFAHLLLKDTYNAQTNKFLPRSLQIDPTLKYSPMGPAAALVLPELIAVDKTKTGLNLTGNLDFSFHARYARAIEKSYFGDLPFLFAKSRDDLRIFNYLHDRFTLVIGSYPVDEDLPCVKLLELVQTSRSPLIGWSKVAQADVAKCEIYGLVTEEADRHDFLSLMNLQKSEESPFNLLFEANESDPRAPVKAPILPLAKPPLVVSDSSITAPKLPLQILDRVAPTKLSTMMGVDGTKPSLNILPQLSVEPKAKRRSK